MRSIAQLLVTASACCTILSAQPTHTLTGGVDTAWMRTYDYGTVTALEVDREDNIYVTGVSRIVMTIKYNPFGDTLWTRDYGPAVGEVRGLEISPPLLAVDGSGNAYASAYFYYETGSGPAHKWYDIVETFKYNDAGNLVWQHTYWWDGRPTSIVVGGDGQLHMTGCFPVWGEITTVKYDLAGDTAWVRHFRGSPQGRGATTLAVDTNGNVYVAGEDGESETDLDIVLIKYDADGDTLWARRYDGPGNGYDGATCVLVSGNDNIYVAGTSTGTASGHDFIALKYNANGDTLWTRRYNGPGNLADEITSAAVDASGSLYVTGKSFGSDTDYDYCTIKFNDAGDLVWMRRYNGLESGPDQAVSLTIDEEGNAYVTGLSDSAIVTIKYLGDGDEAWMARYSYGMGTESSPAGIHLDAAGNVIVAGTSNSSYTVIKYIQTSTSVIARSAALPNAFELAQNYPNPFNPTTQISFQLPLASCISLKVLDLLGREVAVLVNEERPAGSYTASWNASSMPSGVYFCRMETTGTDGKRWSATKKMMLMR